MFLPKSAPVERAPPLCKSALAAGFSGDYRGGIYGGIFSPTEAAAACVLYAVLLEFVVFRSLKMRDIYAIAKPLA